MNASLDSFLQSQAADDALAQYAVRYLVAELTDDLSTESMLSELRSRAASTASTAAVEEVLEMLRHDGQLLAEVGRAVLSAMWEDRDSQPAVRRAVVDAKVKLPVVEVGIVAVAAMYGMYLVATRGRTSHTKTTVKPDGSIETETTTYHEPSEALGVVARLLAAFSQTNDSGDRGPSQLPEASQDGDGVSRLPQHDVDQS